MLGLSKKRPSWQSSADLAASYQHWDLIQRCRLKETIHVYTQWLPVVQCKSVPCANMLGPGFLGLSIRVKGILSRLAKPTEHPCSKARTVDDV